MIQVGDIVMPRGSRRVFFVEEHDEARGEWVLLAGDGPQVIRVSEACARTIVPLERYGGVNLR